ETQGSHVADEMLALRIERAAHRQHRRREIRQRQGEVWLQVRREAAAARPEFEQRAATEAGRETPLQIVRFFDVVLGWRKQRPPFCELVVEDRPGFIHPRIVY